MIFTDVERNFARDLFARIRTETEVPGGGVERPSYGIGETHAWYEVMRAAQDAGLKIPLAPCANLLISTESSLPVEATWIGSHLDSVPCGGNYDGLAGVIAALLILKKAKDRGLAKPLVGVGLRGEESAWFGTPYMGSKALFGKLTEKDLERRHMREPALVLKEAMRSCGAYVEGIARGERFVATNAIREFWELHIEQGPVLDYTSIPVGIVTGIRGNVRAPSARVLGRAGHSGTTPHHLRKDAVMLFAELMVELEARRSSMAASGQDLVFTCGIATTDRERHAITTIADLMHFTLDVRSLEDNTVEMFYDYAKAYAQGDVDWGALVTTPAVELSRALVARATDASDDLGVEFGIMPSGAGHDAAIFQGSGVPSGMIFVRNQHGSHNKHESMNIDDFMLGVEVLWKTVST